MKGLLIIISGPSGTGKGTICDELVTKNHIKCSVSATTRKPRAGEKHGESYFFIGIEEFKNQINENGFLEYAEVFGNYYGTPESFVKNEIEKGNDILLEIDVQGALRVKKKFPECVLVFVLPPSMEELRRRISSRGSEDEQTIQRRLGEAAREIAQIGEYDYAVINDKLEDAVKTIEQIIYAQHYKITEDTMRYIERFNG